MSEWQPIETAPKDEAVIVWGPDVGLLGEAQQDRDGKWRCAICCGLPLDHFRRGVNPTHWMPLPDPPKGTD